MSRHLIRYTPPCLFSFLSSASSSFFSIVISCMSVQRSVRFCLLSLLRISDRCCPLRSSSRSPVYHPNFASHMQLPIVHLLATHSSLQKKWRICRFLWMTQNFQSPGLALNPSLRRQKKLKPSPLSQRLLLSSVADLIQLELLRKENLATQLKIAETELQLAQLKASSRSPEVVGTTPSISPVKLQSAIEPNASSSPSLPSLPECPFLNQLRSRKKSGSMLPNQFLFSAKGTVNYDKLQIAEFVSGYLEFCKVQPESFRVALLNHLQLLMDPAITCSWPSMRNFHLSVHNAVEQGRLTWNSADIIRK